MLDILSKSLSRIQKYNITQQASRFIIVGLASTAISYTTFIICLKLFDLHYLLSNITGFILSISLSYNLNKKWTFHSKETKQGRNYVLFYLGSLILNSILLKIIVEYGGIIPEFAFILTIGIITCINFFGIKFFIFKT